MLKKVRSHHEFMWSYFTALLSAYVRRPAFIFLFFLTWSVAFAFSLIFFLLERGRNPGITSILDAIYFCVATLTTVGFGDIHPHTGWGKLLSIFMMSIGSLLFVSFTGLMTATVLEIEEDQGQTLPDKSEKT